MQYTLDSIISRLKIMGLPDRFVPTDNQIKGVMIALPSDEGITWWLEQIRQWKQRNCPDEK